MAKKEEGKVSALPAVPLGYCQLGTQVAGHTFVASNAAAIGLLQDAGEGRVFKPLGKPECGKRELNFYESLAQAIASTSATPAAENDLNNGKGDGEPVQLDDTEQAKNNLLVTLAAHVPRYYGQLKLVVNQREHTFLKLEDLTHGMAKPCVMDIKIGRRTWDPLSTPEKRAIEEQKYVICKQNLGLCLPGFQVYQQSKEDPDQTVLVRHGREFGKSLNVEGFRQALVLFFNSSDSSDKDCTVLLEEVLRQLRSISAWFKRQRLFNFYASSLLICYDFDKLQKSISSSCSKIMLNGYYKEPQHLEPAEQWVRVRCIDFAHIFPAVDDQPDHNYIFGLHSLIDIIESMMKR